MVGIFVQSFGRNIFGLHDVIPLYIEIKTIFITNFAFFVQHENIIFLTKLLVYILDVCTYLFFHICGSRSTSLIFSLKKGPYCVFLKEWLSMGT
jgi:hypothetical protein